MASKNLFIVFALVAVVLPTIGSAMEHVVGDDKGWTTNFDYQLWAQDKVFVVGDALVFNYPVGVHNVFKVNGTGFKDCIVPAENLALVSGKDVITLSTPGNKWYICGKESHCTGGGQKLKITVQWSALAPTPISPSSATGIAASGLGVLIAATIVTLLAMF